MFNAALIEIKPKDFLSVQFFKCYRKSRSIKKTKVKTNRNYNKYLSQNQYEPKLQQRGVGIITPMSSKA